MPQDQNAQNNNPPETRPLLWIKNESVRNELIKLPESGMGYQIIEATVLLLDDREINGEFLVLNCEYLLPFNDDENFLSFHSLLIKKLRISAYENKIEIKNIINPILKKNLDFLILNKNILLKNILLNIFPSNLWDPKLIQIEQETKAYEAYYRYSAFPDDRRIIGNGNFAAGTFASTICDRNMIHSGFSATGRYALPNPDSAKYVYIIIPKDDTKILKGTVSPAYNQAGGGVEVFFPEGATNQPGKPYLIPEA